MSDEIKLSPCPFCGWPAEIFPSDNLTNGAFMARCIDCLVAMYGDTEAECQGLWNTRVTPMEKSPVGNADTPQAEQPTVMPDTEIGRAWNNLAIAMHVLSGIDSENFQKSADKALISQGNTDVK